MNRRSSFSRRSSAWAARVLFALAGVALVVAISGCPESGINTPTNTPHGTQCLTDMDCMSFQKCSRGGAIMGSCIDKNAPEEGEGGAPVAPPGTLVLPDAGPTGPADGEVQI